jgi:hypothetical protein
MDNIENGEQDRYEQEKQEEADREASSQEGAGNLVSGFSFNVVNIWSSIFSFNDGCASLPIISSWLSLSSSNICPIFPSSVRTAVSPVIALFASILLWIYFYKWLHRGDTNG